MKKGLSIFVIALAVILFGLLAKFYINDISLIREERMVKALPIFRNTSKVGSFTTTWPDSRPGSGISYYTEALPSEVFGYYENILKDGGWNFESPIDPSGLEGQGGLRYKKDNHWLQISVRGQKIPYIVTLLVQR